MTRITLAGTQPNDPVLTNMFMYQKNLHKNKYIANIDNDEMIVPQYVSTWSEMMQQVKNRAKDKVRYFIISLVTSLTISISVELK